MKLNKSNKMKMRYPEKGSIFHFCTVFSNRTQVLSQGRTLSKLHINDSDFHSFRLFFSFIYVTFIFMFYHKRKHWTSFIWIVVIFTVSGYSFVLYMTNLRFFLSIRYVINEILANQLWSSRTDHLVKFFSPDLTRVFDKS